MCLFLKITKKLKISPPYWATRRKKKCSKQDLPWRSLPGCCWVNIAASDLLCCQLYCSQKFSDFYCLHLSNLVFSVDKLIFFSTLARGSPFINTVTPQNVTRKTVPCRPLYKLCRVSGGLSVG